MFRLRERSLADDKARRRVSTVLVPLAEIEQRTHLHLSLQEWEDLFKKAGFQIDGLWDLKALRAQKKLGWWDNDRLVIGRVVSIHKHENADKLIIVNIAYTSQRRPYAQVLTPPPSLVYFKRYLPWFLPVLHVPYAAVGAKVINANSTERPRPLIRVKVKRFRGLPSNGMVCSECEVGLGEYHDDIFFLPREAKVGTALSDYLGDYALRLNFSLNKRRVLSLEHIKKRVLAAHKAPRR